MSLLKLNFLLLTLSAFVYSGCGSSSVIDDDISPSHISKFQDASLLPINYSDFAENVIINGALSQRYLKLKINAKDANVSDFYHMQIYIDSDFNASTGLSMGVEPYSIVGADYMIEDDMLFKSADPKKWVWKYVSDVNNTFCKRDKKEKKGEYRQTLMIDRNLISNIDDDERKIRVSLEPIDEDWTDTNNYLPAETIMLDEF